MATLDPFAGLGRVLRAPGPPDGARLTVVALVIVAALIVGSLLNGFAWQAKAGEGGTSLSGGERRRVSIARALPKNAPIGGRIAETGSHDELPAAGGYAGFWREAQGWHLVDGK